jgi:hypothetical protein
MRRRSAIVLAAAVVFATMLPSVRAQQQDDPSPPANLYTLHVYANLMQFPTVVLGLNLQPIPPVPREKFDISIDGGPVFHPTRMRIEGDDPISLAVLLDAGGDQRNTLQAFAQSFPDLIPGSLHPHDRVSIYAMDCTVMRSLKDEPAVDSKAIARGIAEVLAAPGLHGSKVKPACGYNLHLWDAMTLIAKDLGDSASRRILLVVSQGRENGSKSRFTLVAEYLSSMGVAVFGLRDNQEYAREATTSQYGSPVSRGRTLTEPGMSNDEDLFSVICASNGGMVLDASNPGVAKDLPHLIELLRGRYIIEYPRPDDKTPGFHTAEITIAGANAFIRPTGGSAPIPDPAIANDPNTLPGTPSPAKVGTRRHIAPHS